MSSVIRPIQEELVSLSTERAKLAFQKFVPGSQKVYGVKMPDVNALAKKYKEGGFELATELWQSGAFEEKVMAAKLLGLIAKKDPARTLKMIEKFSSSISDWAVCDTLGMQSPKPLNKKFQEEIFAISNRLIASKDLWQRRLALVLAEWYTRDPVVHPKIKTLLKKAENDKEYYVKKAVAWINRNFEKKR